MYVYLKENDPSKKQERSHNTTFVESCSQITDLSFTNAPEKIANSPSISNDIEK